MNAVAFRHAPQNRGNIKPLPIWLWPVPAAFALLHQRWPPAGNEIVISSGGALRRCDEHHNYSGQNRHSSDFASTSLLQWLPGYRVTTQVVSLLRSAGCWR